MAERISDAEHAVMEVLWDESPLTAQDVSRRVDPARGWSANTVKTLLGRLVQKGAAATDADGRRFLYRPAIARDDHLARETGRLVDRLFGGRPAPLVAHLASRRELSDDDLAELEALIRSLRK